MWAHETGVWAEVHKPAAWSEQARRLSKHRTKVTDVGVGKGGEHRVKRPVGERQLSGVCLQEFGSLTDTLSSETQLVARDVHACHRPAEVEQSRNMEARAAAEIEAPARTGSDQPPEEVGNFVCERLEILDVPVGPAVITRLFLHGLDNASVTVVCCLTIAGSDSGGGAGIQADLKAFAAAGCFGMSVVVALTAQNTTGVTAVHEAPPDFVRAQLEAVFSDLGVDAAKTGMLFSASLIETVAGFLAEHPVPLVVDPVMVASSGAKLLQDDAVGALVARLFPLAMVITPNLVEAQVLTGLRTEDRATLAERLHTLGALAAIVTGGHGETAVDHLFDGERHVEIPVPRHDVAATHGAGCTHSATLAALLARGAGLEEAARGAAEAAAAAVAHGLSELGSGEGPVDVLGVRSCIATLAERSETGDARLQDLTPQ